MLLAIENKMREIRNGMHSKWKKVLNTNINKLNWRFNQIFFSDHKPRHLLYDIFKKMANILCIFSYNSRGFNTAKQVFCCKLLMSSGFSTTILCHQENFLLKANGYIIKQALPHHYILFKPAEKD